MFRAANSVRKVGGSDCLSTRRGGALLGENPLSLTRPYLAMSRIRTGAGASDLLREVRKRLDLLDVAQASHGCRGSRRPGGDNSAAIVTVVFVF